MTHLLRSHFTVPIVLSLLEWGLFTLYWSAAAKNSSAVKTAESRRSRRVHEVLVNVALLLVAIPVFHPIWPGAWLLAAGGLVIQTASILLALWARRHLGANWSGRITIKADHRLIRSGPYRYIRHPIYTALLGMYLGTALVTRQPLAVPGLLMAAFAYWRKIRLEETMLMAGVRLGIRGLAPGNRRAASEATALKSYRPRRSSFSFS